MKKLISLLLSLSIICAVLIPFTVSADTTQLSFENFEYVIQKNGTVAITNYSGSETEITSLKK